jgi:hypothetical protein
MKHGDVMKELSKQYQATRTSTNDDNIEDNLDETTKDGIIT